MKSILLVAVALVASLITSTEAALAQATPVQIFGGEIDGYRLIVNSLPQEPVVGTVHFAVIPTNAITSEPVRNPRIRIVAMRPGGGRGLQSPALKTPGVENQFEGNIRFDDAGSWTVRVEIESDELGASQVEIPFSVAGQALPPGTAGLWVLLVIILAFAGGISYIVYSIRRQRKRLAEASQ